MPVRNDEASKSSPTRDVSRVTNETPELTVSFTETNEAR